LEWNRVLVPDGQLMLAVPNIEALATILIQKPLSRAEKLVIMHIIYGGQDDQYNVHWTGFYWDFLVDILTYTHYCEIRKVDTFGLFEDASTLDLFGYGSISLNIVAKKCVNKSNLKKYEVY